MDASEQAAEQLVRMTLQGTEYTLRLTGVGAKNLAGVLIAIAQGHQQTKGKTRLKTLLDANKELKVFQLDAGDLSAFAKEAKKYGLLYTVIKPGNARAGDMVDVMAKAEDAAKISRILERLGFGRTDVADVVSEIEAAREVAGHAAPDKGVEAKDEAERIVDELFEKPLAKDGAKTGDPLVQKTEANLPSEPISASTARHSEDSMSKAAAERGKPLPTNEGKANANQRGNSKDTAERSDTRRSVKADMDDIKKSRKDSPTPKPPAQQTRHSQDATRRTRKPKPKSKGR